MLNSDSISQTFLLPMAIFKNIFFIVLIAFFSSCQNNSKEEEKPLILVSISPYNTFIEKIIDGFAEVKTIVPAKQNPHFFVPSIKQISNLGKANIYFRIGENFEEKILPSLKEKNSSLEIIDLRKNILLIPIETSHGDHIHTGMDIHLWLSPVVVNRQLSTIETALIKSFPDKEQIIKKRVKSLASDFVELDRKIKRLGIDNLYFLSSHAAFAYFCRDYQCIEIPIEMGQKEPTAKYLEVIMSLYKEKSIKSIVSIPHMNDKGATILAKKFGLKKIIFDPYTSNYFENLYTFAVKLKDES